MSDRSEPQGSWIRFVDPERTGPAPPDRSRPLRRLLRRAVLLLSLLAATAALAGIERARGTEERVAAAIAHGPPDRAAFWTRLQAGVRGPPRVGLQIGHEHAERHPDELARLRTSTGAEADGVREVDVNRSVAEAAAERLLAAGVRVDLLPATVPPGYRADLLVALHADASPDPTRRGAKAAHPVPARTAREPWALRTILDLYLEASGLPDDDANVTGAMLRYYAFDARRFRHAAARSTPAVILEMGYLTHPDDLAWLLDPVGPAEALADAIVRYLAAIDRWHPGLARDPPPDVVRIPPP